MHPKKKNPDPGETDKADAKTRDSGKAKAPKEAPADPDETNPFDFGGLPDRDLKKNLGCGG